MHEQRTTFNVQRIDMDIDNGVCQREIRRRDIGAQSYGSGVPGTGHVPKGVMFDDSVETGIGRIGLQTPKVKHAYLPTVGTLDFLKNSHIGSCRPEFDRRYYPK